MHEIEEESDDSSSSDSDSDEDYGGPINRGIILSRLYGNNSETVESESDTSDTSTEADFGEI